MEAAEKSRKFEAVTVLDDALRTGMFKAKNTSRFAHDSYLVELDQSKCTAERLVVSDSFHSDICDAVLYAFKVSPAYTYSAPIKGPVPGTPAYYDKLTEELEEQAFEHFKKLEAAEKGEDWL